MVKPKVDKWVWGNEQILWGFDNGQKYTFKILEPKVGKDGCLSLQYHHEKSESWLVIRGVVWALVAVGDSVATRIMRPGDGQNLPTGVIHRLMGLTPDCQVAEASTPDKHAADKSVPKDVVRLHCVQGREVAKPVDDRMAKVTAIAVELTMRAIEAVAAGKTPDEVNPEFLADNGSFKI
jgi:mannose-6-phosphate isomerase-like protein (cupin superfamily)